MAMVIDKNIIQNKLINLLKDYIPNKIIDTKEKICLESLDMLSFELDIEKTFDIVVDNIEFNFKEFKIKNLTKYITKLINNGN